MRSRFVRVALLVTVAVLAVACTKTLNTDQLQSTLKTQIETKLNVTGLVISCPKDQPVKVGATFTCAAKDDTGASATITVTQTDDKGHVSWKITAVQTPSATPSP